MTDWPPVARGLPVGQTQGRSWRAGIGAGGTSTSAQQGSRAGPVSRSNDEGGRGGYLDVPPSWSGDNPDKLLQVYLKAAEVWRLTTKTPARQQGVQLLSAAGGDLRTVIGELTVEQLTAEESAEHVINLVKKEYAYAVTKRLPAALEDALFSKAGRRRQGETLVSFTARKVQLLRELERCGCDLPSVARGLILFRDASLSSAQQETAHYWLKNEYDLDAVVEVLRKLERPRVGQEGGAGILAFGADEFEEEGLEEEGEEVYVELEQEAEGEEGWEDEDNISLPEEVAQYVYAQHIMGTASTSSPPRPPSKYTQVKQQQRQMRTQRGYPSSTNSTASSPYKGKGSGKAPQSGKRDRLQALIARTKCAKCGEKGHWARSCPQQQGSAVRPNPTQPARGGSFFLCGAEQTVHGSMFFQREQQEEREQRQRVWRSRCKGAAHEHVNVNVVTSDEYVVCAQELDLAANNEYCVSASQLDLVANNEYVVSASHLDLVTNNEYVVSASKLDLVVNNEYQEGNDDVDAMRVTDCWAVFFARLELPVDHGLIDTGAQSAVCGKQRWQRIVEHLAKQNLRPVQLAQPAMGTTQGIGGPVTVLASYNLPIGVAGVNGLITVTVLESDAPFLIPIPLLFSLGLQLDLAKKRCTWQKLDGRTSQILVLQSQHIALPLFSFPVSGWKLPTTHYALHDNLPVGLYHTGSQRAQAAVYAQVGQVGRSNVQEVSASASSQRATSGAQQDTAMDGGAESSSMGTLHSQMLLPGEVLLASQASDFRDSGEHAASSDRSVLARQADGRSFSKCADQDIRWGNHGTGVADVTEFCTPQVQCGTVPASRQSHSEEGKSQCSLVDMSGLPSEVAEIASRAGTHPLWHGGDWLRKVQGQHIRSNPSRLWSVGSGDIGDGSKYYELKSKEVCGMVLGTAEGGVGETTSSPCSIGPVGAQGQSCNGGLRGFHHGRSERLKVHLRLSGKEHADMTARLQEHHWTVNHHRKENLGISVKTMTLGLYTRQGLGITKEARRARPMLISIHNLVAPTQLEYTTVVLSKLEVGDFVGEHTDKYNHSNSLNYVLALGDFSGGALEVQQDDGSWLSVPVHGQLVSLDQHRPHRVAPITSGVRYSIVLATMGRLQAVPEAAWQELKALGFPVKCLQQQGKQLRDVYQAVELPVETWTGEDQEEVLEDVCMVCVVSDSMTTKNLSLEEKDNGWCLRVHASSTSQALCNCLRDMGFTHWRYDEPYMEFLSQHCFLPGAEDLQQTTWLSQKEEKHILAQVSELYPSAASASASAAAIPEGEQGVEEEAELDVQDTGEYDSDEEDGPPTAEWQPSTKERKAIELLHRNLAHPPSAKLAKVMKIGGVRPEVWKWVKAEFQCEECEKHKPPQPRIPAKLPAVWRLNAILGVDVVFLALPGDSKSEAPWLNIVDWGTGFQQVDKIDGQLNAHTAWRAFCRGWIRMFSAPSICVTDQGLEFAGVFSQSLGQWGVTHYVISSQSPWENGRAERAGKALKEQIGLALEADPTITSSLEYENLVHSCVAARNRAFNHAGFTPIQRVLGYTPDLPEEMEPTKGLSSLYEGPLQSVRRAAAIRRLAMEAHTRLDARRRLLRAWRAKSRSPYASLEVEPGTNVYVWRQGKLGKRGWHGPGVVVAVMGAHKESLFVALGATLWKVSARNIRKASPQETLAQGLVEKFVRSLKSKPGRAGLRRYVDCTREAQHIDEDSSGEDIPGETEEQRANQAVADQGQPEQEQEQPEQVEEEEQEHVEEVTRGVTRQASEGAEEGVQVQRRRLSSTPPQRPPTMPYPAPYWALLECRAGDPFALLVETDVQIEDDTLGVFAVSGPDEHPTRIHLDAGTQTVVKPEHMPEEYKKLFLYGSRLAEEKKLLPALTILSAQEAAQIPRERIIPSRWLDTWKRQDPDQSTQQYPAELGIPAGVVAKSRLIVLGFWDPDIPQLRIASPTPESGEVNIILSLLAQQAIRAFVADVAGAFNQSSSGMRSEPIYLKLPSMGLPSFPHATVARMDKEVNGVVSGPAAWRATFAAYCKELGFQAHRTSPCTFIFRESMWRSWSGVYFCSKGEAMQYDAKRPHDQREPQHVPNGLGGIICVLVDDILGGGRGQKFHEAMQKLKDKVKFGKWEKFDSEREYGGKSIQQLPDGSIILSMVKYVQKLKELDVSKDDRKHSGGATSEQNKTAFRALIGGLLWAARTGVPQVYGDCSLLAGRVSTLTHADRLALNKTLMRAKETVAPIVYPSKPPSDVRWVVWADASLAQDSEGKSQMAWIVAKADCNMMVKQIGWIAPIAWSSHRLKRVATSTLLAELIAIAESVAEAEWLMHWEGLALEEEYNLPKHQDSVQIAIKSIMRPDPSKMPVITIFTDNKAAYDIIEAEKPTFSGIERKAALEAIAVQESVRAVKGMVRWLPHHRNLADGLTKVHGNISGLVQALKTREFEFVSEDHEMKAREEYKKETGRKVPRPNTSGVGSHGLTDVWQNVGAKWTRIHNRPRKALFFPIGCRGGPGEAAGKWRQTKLHFADGTTKEMWDEWRVSQEDKQQSTGQMPWTGRTVFVSKRGQSNGS
eukprot:2923798-Amphidinium_carterae.1